MVGDEPRARTASLQEERARRVKQAFAELPGRYVGAAADFRAVFQIRLGDVGRTWQVRVDGSRCEVSPSSVREPDVVIGTDSGTWIALREGQLSGLDAFSQRRLYARGDLDLALAFEGLFHLPGGRQPLLRMTETQTRAGRITSLVAGSGAEQVLCLHGLGSNKSSFFETVAALDSRYTVHALDLPGFGASDKPSRAPYDAMWFAQAVRAYLDEHAIERAHIVGNSMGGRIALELGFGHPDRVASLSLLAPALAFRRRRQLVPLVRLLRPELAAIPHPVRAATVRAHLWSMFAHPDRLDPAAADIAVEEFCRSYRSRAARIAFFASARNILLDEPHGVDGFYSRLSGLRPPALFVWGDADKLIPAAFSRHVADALPQAEQHILRECGHVPQIELAEHTNGLVAEHIRGAEGTAARRLRRAYGRVAI